jgi:porin
MTRRKDFVRGGARLSCAIGLGVLAAGSAWSQTAPTGGQQGAGVPAVQVQAPATPKPAAKPVQVAQSAGQGQPTGYNITPNFVTTNGPTARPTQPIRPGYLFDLRNVGADFGKRLADDGLYLRMTLFQADDNVVGGGARQSSNYLSVAFFGFDLDAQKLLGWNEALFSFTGDYQMGQTATTTHFASGSGIFTPYGFGDAPRLVSLAYNQGFDNYKYQFQIGRLSPGFTSSPYLSPPFDQAPWHCSFFSFSCGIQAGYALDPSKPTYVGSGWGGDFTYHPAPLWYVKTGVFESEPIEATNRNNDGWPGRDWGLDKSNGGFFPLQVGYQTDFTSAAFPAVYNLGGFYDNAKFPDKLLNFQGLPSPGHIPKPFFDDQDEGLWWNVQKVVWRPEITNRNQRGLMLFASGNWDGSRKTEVAQQYEAGFVETGLAESRSEDTINFVVSLIQFDPREVEFRDDLATLNGSSVRMSSTETDFEVNYGFAVAPGLTLHPYLQYIMHPDDLTETVPDTHDNHTVVLGAFLTTSFNTLFGLPHL